MAYHTLSSCLADLEKHGMLIRIKEEVDPNLEMAEIHRRVYAAQGPAILFERVKGSPFPAVCNVYGTRAQTEFIFRDSLKALEQIIALKIDPSQLLKHPLRYIKHIPFLLNGLPRRSLFTPEVLKHQTNLQALPNIVAWPKDGGGFVTLPQVISFPPNIKDIKQSNVGMYRIQLNGNGYTSNEIGLHYQIHRGIGNHHTMYNQSDEAFRVSIAIGGPPSYAFSAIMPLPEGMSEILFSGLLGNAAYNYTWKDNYFIPSKADFVITGTVQKNALKPEGPFGDHLGYYSLEHDFPFIKVDKVYHRPNPIWHFTTVGRPPQEDSSFGYLIHKIVGDIAKQEFPGVVALHAVDAAGVHPLLFAIGKERYMPFREQKPEEILTIANHILGSGQTSLAKYLFIAADNIVPNLDIHDIKTFFQVILERIDWRYDLHFQTNTTIDTLDYSGDDWNAGSKLVVACNRSKQRNLGNVMPSGILNLSNVSAIHVILPGILAIQYSGFKNYEDANEEMRALSKQLEQFPLQEFPLIVVCDDAQFMQAELNNFLWACFTRSNPSHDIYGIGSFTTFKHWGCTGSLIIDARIKPHHAPVLEVDPEVSKRVDRLFMRDGVLGKVLH